MREEFDKAFRQTFRVLGINQALAGSEAVDIDPEQIKVTWPSPLSGGIADDADGISALVDSGVLTPEVANQLIAQTTEEEAEEQSERPDTGRSQEGSVRSPL